MFTTNRVRLSRPRMRAWVRIPLLTPCFSIDLYSDTDTGMNQVIAPCTVTPSLNKTNLFFFMIVANCYNTDLALPGSSDARMLTIVPNKTENGPNQ